MQVYVVVVIHLVKVGMIILMQIVLQMEVSLCQMVHVVQLE